MLKVMHIGLVGVGGRPRACVERSGGQAVHGGREQARHPGHEGLHPRGKDALQADEGAVLGRRAAGEGAAASWAAQQTRRFLQETLFSQKRFGFSF